MDKKIDFVIAWVDGNDLSWKEEKRKYNTDKNSDNREVRFRDWNNLKYWFRGVEKFAPWVNKIYFVTYGHLPEWLDTNNPKLKVVNHVDYIPSEYLPTFNSHTIELNLHRIKALSENFVYFNDDMFIIDYVKKNDFFKNDLPCDSAVLSLYIPQEYNDMCILCWNMIGIINKYFNKNESIQKNLFKWFNLKNGFKLLRTMDLIVWPKFPGFYETHMPNSYKKSTLETVWNKEYDILNLSCYDKFRNIKTHVNQWIFRYWQLASGQFYPRSLKFSKYFDLTFDLEKSLLHIKNQKSKIVCINDTGELANFEEAKYQVIQAFEKILPDKSSFEK